MKKGTIQLLVTVVFTIIFIILVFKITFGFIKPLFWNDKNGVSYENFVTLTSTINGLTQSKTKTSMREMLLEINPGFNILAFDPQEKEIHTYIPLKVVIDNTYKRPLECEQNKGCLCIYHGIISEDNLIECKNFKDTYFYSILDKRLITGSMGSEKTNHPKTHYKDEEKYEGVIFYGDLKLTIPAVDISVASFPWNIQRMYIENYKENGVNHVLISPLNNKLLKRFKMISNCPPKTSDEGCKNYEYYDKIIKEKEKKTGVEKIFVCKFNEEKNKCEKKTIKPCKDGLIEEECACGETAYDVGMCINKDWYDGDIPSDYCFENQIDKTSKCDTYKKGNPEDKYACTFNVCGLKNNCYWSGGSCISCADGGSCKDYKEGWVRFIDSCDYDKDNQHPDTNDCLNCKQINNDCENYPSESQCINNDCGVVVTYKITDYYSISKECVPLYTNKVYDNCIDCPEDCTCDDYISEELRLIDPCDCDGDGKIGATEDSDGCKITS